MFAVASCVSLYTFEHGSGWDVYFLFMCVIAFVATVFLTIGFGVGAAMTKRFASRYVCGVLGACASLAFIFLLWLLSAAHASALGSWFAVMTLPFIGGVMPLFGRRDVK